MASVSNVIKINGALYKIGSKFVAKPICHERGICAPYEIVTLRTSKSTDMKNLVGIYSDINHGDLWSSLDGLVNKGQGLWIEKKEFFFLFDPHETMVDGMVTVEKDFFFKNRNLKGMRGRIINSYPTRDGYFVELETDVGGGSADGMCGSGRCVVIPERILDCRLGAEDEVVPLPEAEPEPTERTFYAQEVKKYVIKSNSSLHKMTAKFDSFEETPILAKERVFDVEAMLQPSTFEDPSLIRLVPKKTEIKAEEYVNEEDWIPGGEGVVFKKEKVAFKKTDGTWAKIAVSIPKSLHLK